ncbi:hypothetical protein ACHMW7_21115 [Aminobacter sp. UC22_36]|uniref:hypothetical protein n=1 Tax=Aminobacter sp. UC22_36 TaxID=3374549 RepID=UPI003757F591
MDALAALEQEFVSPDGFFHQLRFRSFDIVAAERALGLLRQTEAGHEPRRIYRLAYLLWSAHTELEGISVDAGEHVARYRSFFFAEVSARFEAIGKLGGMA